MPVMAHVSINFVMKFTYCGEPVYVSVIRPYGVDGGGGEAESQRFRPRRPRLPRRLPRYASASAAAAPFTQVGRQAFGACRPHSLHHNTTSTGTASVASPGPRKNQSASASPFIWSTIPSSNTVVVRLQEPVPVQAHPERGVVHPAQVLHPLLVRPARGPLGPDRTQARVVGVEGRPPVDEQVVAESAAEAVRPAPADQYVAAVPAQQSVAVSATQQDVVAGIPGQEVAASARRGRRRCRPRRTARRSRRRP